MRRADARNAIFPDHTLSFSTGKLGGENHHFRLMLPDEPAEYVLGYFAVLGHDMSFYAAACLRSWPHEVVVVSDVIKGEIVRRQTAFLQYPNDFTFDCSKDFVAPVECFRAYYAASVHPPTFFLTEVALVAPVPEVRTKVDSGFGRHIVALADHQ